MFFIPCIASGTNFRAIFPELLLCTSLISMNVAFTLFCTMVFTWFHTLMISSAITASKKLLKTHHWKYNALKMQISQNLNYKRFFFEARFFIFYMEAKTGRTIKNCLKRGKMGRFYIKLYRSTFTRGKLTNCRSFLSETSYVAILRLFHYFQWNFNEFHNRRKSNFFTTHIFVRD